MTIKVSAPVRIDISAGWPDSDPYRKDFGGTVLNIAISPRVSAEFQGINLISSLGDVPPSSGLGTSAALRSCYVAASNPKLLEDRLELVRKVHMFENQVLNQRAGFQDEAAAIYGGGNYWEFGINGSIKRIEIPADSLCGLQNRLVLIDTGASHLSANIHDLVFGPQNYERNIPALDRMKELAGQMMGQIDNEGIMAQLITKTWELQKSLHESIETDVMKSLQEKLKGYYSAARAPGAGGGGAFLFYANDRQRLIERFEQISDEFPGIKILPFKIDYTGIKLER